MRLAAQRASGAQGHFIKLDILFQIQRRQRADFTLLVRAKHLPAIHGTNHLNLGGRGLRTLNEFLQGHPERSRDAEGHGQGRVRLLTLNLAQHRPAHPARRGQFLQRPAAIRPQFFNSATDKLTNLFRSDFLSLLRFA